MRRHKKLQLKSEKPETSSSNSKPNEEHDLAYYIHDRVELLHQVFQSIKPKELKAIVPDCVRHVSLDDLQELCLEELLGISSKRLCAVLDGAEPPSDTESSSQSSEHLETISLDSISSDEDLLDQGHRKHKKHKHRRNSKSGKKKKKVDRPAGADADGSDEDERANSRAPRARLTVLELLELQARARAIKAQLRVQQAADTPPVSSVQPEIRSASDNEVEIKEEPAEVVEISSDGEEEDEKPKLNSDKTVTIGPTSKHQTPTVSDENPSTISKRINNLVITIPQSKPTRKIKLKRNNVSVTVTQSNGNTDRPIKAVAEKTVLVPQEDKVDIVKETDKSTAKGKDKSKKKRKGKKKQEKDGSDHDEITLQLSDTEKMDLLEDFDAKNYSSVSASSSEDSGSSSSDSDGDVLAKDDSMPKLNQEKESPDVEIANIDKSKGLDKKEINSTEEVKTDEKISNDESKKNVNDVELVTEIKTQPSNEQVVEKVNEQSKDKVVEKIDDTIEIATENSVVEEENKHDEQSDDTIVELNKGSSIENTRETAVTELNTNEKNYEKDTVSETKKDETRNQKIVSDGEISDNSSSEIEATDIQQEVVCISDDEGLKKKHKTKKSKKDKKSKKVKKAKKSKSDFLQSSDQNFFTETVKTPTHVNLDREKSDNVIDDLKIAVEKKSNADENVETVHESDSSDIFELIELSDDSSLYEVEGVSVLSKEPTAEEIQALSVKIDEIKREDVITDAEIENHDRTESVTDEKQDADNISWKDRYLDSKKVKKVLTISNIWNALRNKNKELKLKLKESKKAEQATVENLEVVESKNDDTVKSFQMVENTALEEGSIEYYNTLEGSTKYVDPIVQVTPPDASAIVDNYTQEVITGEMKKDAKQLLKMYKKLLKYNDMTKQKDPEKKKRKKKKKEKEREGVANANIC